MDATMRLDCAVHPSYQVIESGSHTLQGSDHEDTESLRARLIDATVEAVAGASAPRLSSSRY